MDRPPATTPPPDLQLDWDTAGVRAGWFDRPDDRYLIDRLLHVTPAFVLRGEPRRVLDVAAAEGIHTADLALAGVDAVAIDPSRAMLARAREEMARRGVRFVLVRGIAETMPFRDASFDCVLCHGAIDHVADPASAVREMARVLTADGRLVISGVNYEGLSVRVSRLCYGIGRRLGVIAPADHLYWDSPVPAEHSFECSYPRLRRLCEPYLELEDAVGVSLGVGVPGWGVLLSRLPRSLALTGLRRLDAAAARLPRLADFVYTIWRPRPRAAWPTRRSPADGGFAVRPDDVTYPHKVAGERRHWTMSGFDHPVPPSDAPEQQLANSAFTGVAGCAWIDDLLARGPFGHAAVLGCDEVRFDRVWLGRNGSRALDVYDLAPAALAAVRRQLGPLAARVRFIEADLNFAALPAERYDVIWSSGCLHHVINLEHLLAQVERALRPGGVFAFHDYVGERRFQYSPARLARVASVLGDVPPRWRWHGAEPIGPPDPNTLSPFCGMRPGALLPLASARFDLVHQGLAGALLPLVLHLDVAGIAREDPVLLAHLAQAEEDARRDPATPPCVAYAVFRRR